MFDTLSPQEAVKVSLEEPAEEESIVVHSVFSGRINRLSYFAGPFILEIVTLLASSVLSIAYDLVADSVGFTDVVFLFGSLMSFLLLILYWPSFIVRRAHDLGMSGLFILLFFIPVINIAAALILLLKPGKDQINRYGAPPKRGVDLLNLFSIII